MGEENVGSRRSFTQLLSRLLVSIPITFACVAGSGCGVTLSAQRVSTPEQTLPGEGIVYALPKTELEVVQPVKITVPTAGALSAVFDACERACEDDPVNAGLHCAFDATPTLALGRASVRTVSVPDRTHLYRVSPKAGAFRSLDMSFAISETGVLEQADTSAENTAYELVSAISKTALKAAFAGQAALVTPAAPAAPSCVAVQQHVETLVETGRGVLNCTLQKEISACLAGRRAEVAAARSALRDLYANAPKMKMDAKLLEIVAAFRRDQLAAAITRHDAEAAPYGLKQADDAEASYELTIPAGSPADFTVLDTTIDLKETINDGQARLAGTSDASAKWQDVALKALSEAKRSYALKVTPPADVVAGTGVAGDGYRYRVPVTAPVSLTTTDALADGTSTQRLPIVEWKLIAQFGPIAALPSEFKGKGGHVLVKHWPQSGGLQTVEIGATPIPSEAVASVVETAATQYQERREARAEEAAAAAAADPELADLTRQYQLLELRKKIKDLEDALDGDVGE